MQCGYRAGALSRVASRQGQGLRRRLGGGGLRHRDLGRRLAGGPVGADRTRGLQQQREVLPGQHLDISIWIEDDHAIFVTRVGDTVVLDSGRMTFV